MTADNDDRTDRDQYVPRTFTTEQIDWELERRKRHPPYIILGDECEEWTTVALLRTELESTPVEDRSWREWELALAERQAVTEPGKLFYRIVKRR